MQFSKQLVQTAKPSW